MRRVFAQSRSALSLALGCWLVIAVSGCGSGPKLVTLVPAEGFVKINGEPAANIMVQLLPNEFEGSAGPTSTGISDEEGWFELQTTDGRRGAVPGPCKVVLSDLEEERPRQGEEPSKPSRVPPKYTTPSPQSLTIEIVEGDPLLIEVTSQQSSGAAGGG